MQGGIAQTISLVFAANAWRRKIAYSGWPNASVYQFCDNVSFIGRKRAGFFGFGRSLVLVDPNAWLDTLPEGMAGARLRVMPRNEREISDRESVGFANGGPMFFAQIAAPTSEAWYGKWQVTNQEAPDQRIWSVTYQNLPNMAAEVRPKSQQEVHDALVKALDDVLRFSEAHKLGFSETFVAAKNALGDEIPLRDFYHDDLVPTELLSLTELQIFSCAAKAWVFGGMGSWNDVWFDGDDQEVYRAVSERLFSAIIDGLVYATNASAEV